MPVKTLSDSMDPISLDSRELLHTNIPTACIPMCTCADLLRRTRWVPLIRGLRWRERCGWVGFCGGWLLFTSTSVCRVIRTGCRTCLPTCWRAVKFHQVHPWRIFTDLWYKQQQVSSSSISWSKNLGHKYVGKESSHTSSTGNTAALKLQAKLMGTLTGSYNLRSDLKTCDMWYETMIWNFGGIHTRAMNHPSWTALQQLTE